RDPGRPRDGPTPRRRRHHRDHLRVARAGPAHRPGPAPPCLPRGAGSRVRDLRHLHTHQPPRRSALRLARSAHAPRGGGVSVAALKRNGLGLLGLALAGLAVLAALAAPLLAPHDPVKGDFSQGLKPPGTPGHPLGTDQLGRDTRARVPLFIGLCTVLLTAIVGGLLGLLAGFFGGWPGQALMRLCDVQLSFPFILLALTINAIVGLGLRNIIVSLAAAGWVVYARVVRGEVLSVKQRDYVQAAAPLGTGRARILLRHILPN